MGVQRHTTCLFSRGPLHRSGNLRLPLCRLIESKPLLAGNRFWRIIGAEAVITPLVSRFAVAKLLDLTQASQNTKFFTDCFKSMPGTLFAANIVKARLVRYAYWS